MVLWADTEGDGKAWGVLAPPCCFWVTSCQPTMFFLCTQWDQIPVLFSERLNPSYLALCQLRLFTRPQQPF